MGYVIKYVDGVKVMVEVKDKVERVERYVKEYEGGERVLVDRSLRLVK